MIDIAQIRLECLKLANRSDLLPSEVVNRAIGYEQYVMGAEKSELLDNRNPKRPGRPVGKTTQL